VQAGKKLFESATKSLILFLSKWIFDPDLQDLSIFAIRRYHTQDYTSGTMDFNGSSKYPEGVISFLDTDLYKLTMQCAVLKYFPDTQVTYAFKNRTPEKKLSRVAFKWLAAQINS